MMYVLGNSQVFIDHGGPQPLSVNARSVEATDDVGNLRIVDFGGDVYLAHQTRVVVHQRKDQLVRRGNTGEESPKR